MFFRVWQSFRIGLLLLLFVGLTIYLVATTPWARWFGKPPTYRAMLMEGDPLVAGIYRFRSRCGLWPEYLDDLVPAELAAPPGPHWYYIVTPAGPSLAAPTPERRTHVGYDFDPAAPAWRVFGEVENRLLRNDAGSAATHPAPPSPDERRTNERAELERRIAREPTLFEHRRDYVSFLRFLGREKEAIIATNRAAADFPAHFWPPLARSVLVGTPAARQQFVDWVRAHPSFTHSYYLARLYQLAGDDAHAEQAAAESLASPVEVAPDDPNVLAFYLWDMSRTAAAHRDWPLVFRLTVAWEKARQAHRLEEGSDLPLRAAAELATGNIAAARAALATFDRQKPPAWAQHLDALRVAIDHQDRAFHYDPGPLPPPYEIFSLPQ